MPDRDRIGQRKVRLMAAWVAVGIALIALGLFSSPWISLLGACIIGATPVYFTLRTALAAPRRPPKRKYDAIGDDIERMIGRVPPGSRRMPPRRGGHKP